MNRRSFIAGLLATTVAKPAAALTFQGVPFYFDKVRCEASLIALLEYRMKEAEEIMRQAMNDALIYGSGPFAEMYFPNIHYKGGYASLDLLARGNAEGPLLDVHLPTAEHLRSL